MTRNRIRAAVLRWADNNYFNTRPPDETVPRDRPEDGKFYLLRWYVVRWYLFKRRVVACYLHKFMRSDDDDQALHDHPAANVSFILRGMYDEWIPTDDRVAVPSPITMRYSSVPGSYLTPYGVLAGEIQICRIIRRKPGDLVFRRADALHRVELIPDPMGGELPVWSLFLFGPVTRVWGFKDIRGWHDYLTYLGAGADARPSYKLFSFNRKKEK